MIQNFHRTKKKTSANFRLADLLAATTIDCSGLYHMVSPLVSTDGHFLTFFQKSFTHDPKFLGSSALLSEQLSGCFLGYLRAV